MIKNLKIFCLLLLSIGVLNLSCRKEESEFIQAPEEESLEVNSNIARLLQKTALKDGSGDNIIDQASCFSVQLPVTVIANGFELNIITEADLELVEDIFDEFEDDEDLLEIVFPINIILSDFTEVFLANPEEFEDFADDCLGENEEDEDIECVDIAYPVTASIFNSNNEVIDTITISNDKELYEFIDKLEEEDIVNINFPITVILADGSELEASNLDDLEDIIENASDDCDEDDDNDFNDDDCDNCTTDQLATVLVGCSNWTVDKLERDDEDLEDFYTGYVFNFESDGTVTASSGTASFSGSWESDGSGNSIVLLLDIPDLSDFSASWNLHEIEISGSENRVDLRLGESDRLRFESGCP